MAFNFGNGCFAAAIFNAIEPFKAILTDRTEYIGVASKNFVFREIDFGLLYLFYIDYLTEETFMKNGNPLLYIHVIPSIFDSDMFGKKIPDYIDLYGSGNTHNPTFLESIISALSVDNYGHVTSQSILQGLSQYNKPIALILNDGDTHFLTAFYTPGFENKICVINDGIISYANIDSLLSSIYSIVGAVEVLDTNIFNAKELNEILYGIYIMEDQVHVQIHDIGYNANKQFIVTCTRSGYIGPTTYLLH